MVGGKGVGEGRGFKVISTPWRGHSGVEAASLSTLTCAGTGEATQATWPGAWASPLAKNPHRL